MRGSRAVAYLLVACVVFWGRPGASARTRPGRRLARLAAARLGRDFRIRFTFQGNARLCGGEGDAWVGRVQVNRFSRRYDAAGRPTVLDRWVDLDKTYFVFVDDLNGPDPQLADADQCME